MSDLVLRTASISAVILEYSSSESLRFPMDLVRQSLKIVMSLS